MPLASGTRLGPYEVGPQLGAGGMGEVYRARDPRLGRDVAIKVLPASFSDDDESLRRFEQEARAASALNHPGILTIHDFGRHDGAPYVVAELLEGQNLRDRMAGSALPIRKALDYAIQLARGLAAAHEKGIVHRDLKPENVFVTVDGRVKILDFGLAKMSRPGLAHGTAIDGPTLGTEPGMILGTVGYMSPEQVRGLPADHRSDIFSFGAILYEMVTGEQAFKRSSPVETLSAILKEEPREISQGSAKVPPDLARILGHCLEKDPAERFQSALDIAFDLDTLARASGREPAVTAVARGRTSRTSWLPIALAALATLGIGFALGALRRTDVPAPSVAVHRLTDFAGLEETPAISPDGKSVAFTAHVGHRRQVWVRLLAGGAALQLTRDDVDHEAPRWAPDGASLVYYCPPSDGEAQGTVWEVPALGGSPRRITSSIGGADISHDGTRIAFFRFEQDEIHLIVSSRDGAAPRVIAKLALGSYYLSPRWAPDDQSIAYQRGYVFTHDIFAVSANGGEPQRISREGRMLSGFTWTADGAGIVYSSARESTVLYLPTFNLWTARRDGSGLRQLTFGEVSYVSPDLDANGRLVASRVTMSLNIWKFPVDGDALGNVSRGVQITRQTGQVQTPSVGASDREVVYLSDSGGHGNLWVVDTTTGVSRQITYEQDPDVVLGVPVWSPDGKQIAYYSTRAGIGWNWLVNPDGGNPRQFTEGGWASWSRDGRWLYLNENTPGVPTGALGPLKKIRPEEGTSVTVRDDKGNRSAISPDGSTLYFVVERPAVSGGTDYEVHVASPENGPSRILAQIPALRIPVWQLIHPVISPDGKWLALPLTDGFATNIWALPTSGGPLRQLTDFGQRPTYIARRVSWSADGKAIFAALGEGDADVVLLRGLGTNAR